MIERNGVTLIELVVVLAIAALLVASASLSLNGPLRNARSSTLLNQMQNLHKLSRERSLKQASGLEFDLEQQVVRMRVNNTPLQQIHFEGALKLQEVVRRGAVIDRGKMEVQYSAGGCVSFYVRVARNGERGRWLAISGPTGNITTWDANEITAQQLSQWSAKRPNAN